MKWTLKAILASALLCVSAVQAQALEHGPQAPDFTGIEQWHNSAPLKMAQLKGQVVLIDFWTYTCINCIHIMPYVANWYDKYKAQGLQVVGVHTPEFPFEHASANVAEALKKYNIRYPVAQDNQYATWNAYNNQYWPALYLVNKKGKSSIATSAKVITSRPKTPSAMRWLNGIEKLATGLPQMFIRVAAIFHSWQDLPRCRHTRLYVPNPIWHRSIWPDPCRHTAPPDRCARAWPLSVCRFLSR